MYGSFSQDVYVLRKEPRTDGNYEDIKPNGIPALYGYHLSHVIHDATVMPRTTANERQALPVAKEAYTGKTLSCDPTDDIDTDDVIMYENYAGKWEVFKVEGETTNDFVSPYTGFVGGKEVFLGRFRRRG